MDAVIISSGPKDLSSDVIFYRTIGPYKIAHHCRKLGYKIKIIDHASYFEVDELVKVLEKYITAGTLILGISTTFLTRNYLLPDNVLTAISIIVNRFPKLKIVLGGYNTITANLIKEFDVYAIILQYGEDIFRDLLTHLKKQGSEPSYSIEFNSHTGKLIKVFNRPLIMQHNIEDEDFKFSKDDNIVPNETLPLEVSRGCIFKCRFCNHLLLGRGKLDYLRNFELIKEELLYNYENWGTTSYYIICDTFNDTEYKMKEWYKIISSLPFKIKYTAYLRADLLDRFQEIPYLLRDTGLVAAFHGIESLNKESASAAGKGWSGSRARDYIPELYHDIWNKEVFQTLSFIAGLPGDTKENIKETVEWFNQNNLFQLLYKPLGLTNNKNIKNLSEFEKNYEKYGYRFDTEPSSMTDRGNWKTDYWSWSDVVRFLQEIQPEKKSSRYSSWLILYFIGLGIDQNLFKNKSTIIPISTSVDYLSKYKNSLLDQ
jgi:radical SAM superfamily enzyme YgiQ (UPF0313 family)